MTFGYNRENGNDAIAHHGGYEDAENDRMFEQNL
jgi:hypothetical protein